jgi:hypothetical protein
MANRKMTADERRQNGTPDPRAALDRLGAIQAEEIRLRRQLDQLADERRGLLVGLDGWLLQSELAKESVT